jgi:uncharacterized membrane protein
MTQLALGLLLFLAVHSLRIIAPLWRYRQIARWGQTRFRLVYGLLSLLTLWWAVQGYAQARGIGPELWQAPHGLRHFSVALMWPAMVLLAAWAIPGNGIKAKLRHPMILSVKVWALAHLVSNGRGADVLLFGALLLWSVLLYRAMRRDDRSNMVGLMGTRSPLWNLGTVIALLLGTGLWFWLTLGGGHLMLMGVSPLG